MAKHNPRRKSAYYTAFVLRDGTVVFASEDKRKPHPSQRRFYGPIDDDGVWREFSHRATNLADLSDRSWAATQAAITCRLNVRRSLRELVMPTLNRIEKKLQDIEARLFEQQRRQ